MGEEREPCVGMGGGAWGGREGRDGGEREKTGQFEEAAHLVSHPLAGLFELFALGDAVLRLLHIVLSLLHPPLYVVHQPPLRAPETSGVIPP